MLRFLWITLWLISFFALIAFSGFGAAFLLSRALNGAWPLYPALTLGGLFAVLVVVTVPKP